MIYIGIDVAKDSLVGARVDRSFCVRETYLVPNTKEKIEELLTTITKRWRRITMASEATGQYHRLLAKMCVTRGIPFRLLNPIVTKQFTKATVRRRKTDLTDAVIIARLAIQGEGTLLTKESFSLAKQAVRTAVKLSQLEQTLHLMKQKLEMVEMDRSLIVQLDNCKRELSHAQASFKDHAVSNINPFLYKLLQSIPGVGVTISAILIAELERIEKFPNGDALVAFCGLDPRIKQSGGSLHHNTHITKRGSPTLRKTIFLAASIAQRHNKELKIYFKKKRNEGKFYKEATVAVARKLLYRVYAVWKRQTPYIPA